MPGKLKRYKPACVHFVTFFIRFVIYLFLLFSSGNQQHSVGGIGQRRPVVTNNFVPGGTVSHFIRNFLKLCYVILFTSFLFLYISFEKS